MNLKDVTIGITLTVLVGFALIGVFAIVDRAGDTQQQENVAAEPNQPIWGQGETPAEWQSWFGNDNMARLNYAQTDRINAQGQALAEVVERVRKLEEANKPIDMNDIEVRVGHHFGDANDVDIVPMR